jgi:type VI secretion system protein ImpH
MNTEATLRQAEAASPSASRVNFLPADFWQRLQQAPHEHDLYHLLRWIDARAGARQLLGRAPRPQDEPVRMRQEPSMAFAPATLAGAAPGRSGRPPEVSIYSFGLFGPNGPLPLHLTEFVRERQLHHGDHTLSAFANIFHHRLILLFYRAWADAQATVSLDGADSRFGTYLASLLNLGLPSMRRRDSLADHAKYFMAPHLARQTRNPEGLKHILQSYFGVPVKIQEFVAHWIRRTPDQCLSLRGRAGLGQDTLLGIAVHDAQHKFRIEIGPLTWDGYTAFLPGRRRARQLMDWVRQYVGFEFAWDVQLVLARPEVPGVRLNEGAPLGLASWLGRRDPALNDARDLVMDLESRAAT